MTQHLKSCRNRKTSALPPDSPRKEKAPVFHLIVEALYLPEYWMHIEVSAVATLTNLDQFLRATWLECCGHLSAFTIGGKTYLSQSSEDLDDEDMDVPIGAVLRPRTKFDHRYDFGTTTELALRVGEQRVGSPRSRRIDLLARNEPPPIPCGACGTLATEVCSQCIDSREGWLCDRCARKHECGAEMLLPVVNSPRVGICGYTG